ncbi:suppressor of fused domain protein [Streptomyces sp. NP-1717]|uniref:suppressor of fused domain protein n=1 Tax=Streptomyces sp. NP-1717 TaxID=2704470 RepID=UPI001F5CF9C6|nr:suppressor of fused domain protein [Streptomyces sp. NP-1717]MCI3227031.1 hypothetical protein [Streptomyces sp. NP-1717]
MDDSFIASVIAAYAELYGPATRVRRFSRTEPPPGDSAVVVYLPLEAERIIPQGNLTLLATAGFGSQEICVDFPCELGIEIRGSLDECAAAALAEALVELAEVPLEGGHLFHDGQILTNVSLPVFLRFNTAMLVDWDSVDGFRFPQPLAEIGCLRVVPLFAEEMKFVESYADRHLAYRALRIRGMDETDPDRDSTV